MKRFYFVFLALAVLACGRVEQIPGPRGEPGQSIVGPTGPQGLPGEQGPAGEDGQDGRDAVPVVAVKLCPGESVYPSQFVEYAFCIDGRLYAVYSQHDGFLTYIPPGRYESRALNSRCSFTVSHGCQVSQ